MRTAALGLLVALAGIVASEPVEAHRRGGTRLHLGFHFGAPIYWGPHWSPWWHYPPPYSYYYYPAPAVVVPSQPTTYIERGAEADTPSGAWWYYCDTARGYYPYVKECPSGWQRVPPAPPPAK